MLREKVNNEREIRDYMYCKHYLGWDPDLKEGCEYTLYFLWCHECPRGESPGQGDKKKGVGNVV